MSTQWSGLVPTSDTQADEFISKNPHCDGRNVVVAILDTGVDPGAIGLQRTSDGRPKVIDLVDATGAGDVDTSKVVTTIQPASVQGLSGRTLKLGAWDNPSGKYHLGVKRGYELFPKSLVKRLQGERSSAWNKKQRAAINDLESQIASLSHDADKKEALADAKVTLSQLRDATTSTSPDEGPVYDLVVFQDGSGTWRCAIDVCQTGDLRGSTLYTNYRAERQYGTFEPQDGLLNFAINIYDSGNVVSIYCDTGAHGTHVAGIVAGYNPEQSDLNGVAPGAQIVGIKIGDTRLGSMETGPGLERGLMAVLENKCDIINMSYGEPTKTPNEGRFADFARQVVEEHGVVFVASAGNAGPALSTAGAPGGTTTSIIGVGAYVSPHMMRDEYSMRQQKGETKSHDMDTYPSGMQYTWSSRGPAFDGDYGPNVSAPGGAIACVPNWTLQRNQLMNGTSMSSPNCAGNVALMISALKHAGSPYTPHLIKRALENTAKSIPNMTIHDIGHGLIQTMDAFTWITKFGRPEMNLWTTPTHMQYHVYRRTSAGMNRGIYLRDAADLVRPLVTKIGVKPSWREVGNTIGGHTKRDRIEFQLRATLTTTANWVQAPDQCLLAAPGKEFDVRVDPTGLAPGMHYAEIQGRSQGMEPTSGPLFRFPITILIPEPIGNVTNGSTNYDYHFVLSPGQIERRFLTIPEDATWIDVSVTGGDTYGGGDNGTNPRLYALHMQQVCEQEAHRDITWKKFFYLSSPNREVGDGKKVFSHSFGAASGGQTMELCFGQYWSSLGDSSVTINARFRTGIVPSTSMPTLVSGEGWTKINVRNPASGGTVLIKPTGKLTHWTRVVLPASSKVIPPNVQSRDVWPDGKMTQCLEVTFPFDQPKKGKITPSCPVLANLLYDSPVGAQMYIVRNAQGRVLGVSDAFPEEVEVPKGTGYTITLHVAHHDLAVLKKFETTPLHVTRKLPKAVSVSFHKSRSGVACGSESFGSRKLRPGTHCTVFVSCPESNVDEKLHQPGDFLTGTISYCDSETHQKCSHFGAGKKPGGYPFRVVVAGGRATKGGSGNGGDGGNGASSVTPGTLTSRTALIHEWSIKRMRKEFEGKEVNKDSKVGNYDGERALLLQALESSDISTEELVVLQTMMAQSYLHHVDSKGREQFYLSSGGAHSVTDTSNETKSEGGVVSGEEVNVTVGGGGGGGGSDGETTGKSAQEEQSSTFENRTVVDAADALIALIDKDAMSLHFGQKIPESDKEGQKVRKNMQSLRTILRDALTRKMHALLSTLSFDEQEHAVIVEAHYEEMQRWCNVEKDDYLQYRLATWKKESGKALKTLLTIAKEYDTKKHVVSERKVREELLKLYEEFGWDHLVDNEKRFIQMHYPRN